MTLFCLQTRDGGNPARDSVAVGEVLHQVRGVGGAGGAAGGGQRAARARAQPHHAVGRQVTHATPSRAADV